MDRERGPLRGAWVKKTPGAGPLSLLAFCRAAGPPRGARLGKHGVRKQRRQVVPGRPRADQDRIGPLWKEGQVTLI